MTDLKLNIPIVPLPDFFNFISTAGYSSVFVLTDNNTSSLCLPKIKSHLPSFVEIKIKSGENNKVLDTCEYIWQQLFEKKADRKSLLVCLGGGVICDMGAFCASVYMRGIDFVFIPTTLLCMCDAAVGGKTGIDFNFIKNGIGTFTEPKQIVIETNFLTTLPHKELLSGYAEVIKHALISDAEMWKYLKDKDWEKLNWKVVVNKSVQIKKRIVKNDPLEKNTRKKLNFGHTVGHAIESYYLQQNAPKTHGEAVAAGIKVEITIARMLGLISEEESSAIIEYINKTYTPIKVANIDTILELMSYDKKNVSGKLLFSIPNQIGNCLHNIEAEKSLVKEALQISLA